MAKGTNIGFLNFGMGGDNKALIASLDEAEKKALRVQDIMKSIGSGRGGNRVATLLQETRAQNAQNESQERQRALQQRTAREILRTEAVRQRSLSQSSASQSNANNLVSRMNRILQNQDSIVDSLTKKAVGLFSAYQIGNFIQEVVKVRGEIQQLEFAFETMLGSKSASENMMKDIVNLSLETPYTLTEMAGNVKQLIAMGIEADKVVATMKSLGDVAAGVSVPIWRIAINYGQVAALGKLQGREVRDFAMAGIPIVQQLADQMGKTTAEIQDMVSAGKIGFPDVEEAFKRMSGEGGKFNNMMQKQNSSVLGQIGKLKEQVQLMLNSIGESSEGVIYGALNVGSELVHNYELIGKTLIGLIATYGVYRTALIANSIAVSGLTITENIHKLSILATDKAYKILQATMLKNPIVAVAYLVVGLTTAMWALSDSTDGSKEAQEKYNKVKAESIQKETEHKEEIEKLISAATNQALADFQRVNALEELKKKYPQIFEKYDIETLKLADILKLKKEIAEMDAKTSSEERKKLYEDAQKKVNEARANLEKAQNSPTMRYEKTRTAQQRLDQALKDLEPFEKDYTNDRITSFISNIGTMTDAQIQAELSARERIIAKLNYNGGNSGQLNGGLLDGEFDKDQIQRQTDALKVEVAKRKIPQKSFLEWNSQYNDELKELLNKRKKIVENPNKLKEADLTSALNEVDEEIKEKKAQIKLLEGDKDKEKKEKKDPFIDKLKKEIELVKTAQTEYEKLKQIHSEDEAFAKVKEQAPFKDYTKEMLTNEGMQAIIQKQIEQLKGKPQTQALSEYYASLFVLSTDIALKIAKENTEKIESGLKKYKSEYSLFESLFAITGDKEQSSYLAFGKIEDQVESYIDKVRETIAATTDPDFKKKLSEELVGLEFDQQSEFSKRMAELVKEFQSLEDKITVIKSKGEADRLKILANADNASQSLIDARLKANEESIGKQISDLTQGALQATESYQRLFSNMSDISARELQYIIDQWKTAIDSATKDTDGRSYLSIDNNTYTVTDKELTNLSKQILKTEKELDNRNPFKSLIKSFKELGKQSKILDNVKETLAKTQAELSELEAKGDPADTDLVTSLKKKIKELEEEIKRLKGQGDSSWSLVSADIDKANASFNDIASSVTSLFDSFGASDKTTSKIKDLIGVIGGLGETASGLAKIQSGDVIGGISQSIKGITATISSVGSLIDGDKGLREYEKAIEMYKRMEAVLSQVINRQKELLNISVGSQSVEHLKNSINAIEKQIDYQKKVLDKFMDSGGGIGSHSKGYRENRYIKKWQSELQSNGFDIKSWEDVYKLSADEIYDLQSKMPEFYAGLFDDTKNYLELVIDKEKELLELKELEKEALTGLNFDSLLNGLDGFLQATDTTFGKVGDSFEDHMRNAILNFVKEQYLRDALTEWYDQFADHYRDDELNSTEVDALKQMYENIYNQAQSMYDSALDVAGINKGSSTKDGLSKGIASVTEDTANLLASYLNAIRADVSVNRQFMTQLVQLSQLNSNTFAAQLAELVKIQVNTLATANNTSRNADLVTEIRDIMKKVTVSGSGTKINI